MGAMLLSQLLRRCFRIIFVQHFLSHFTVAVVRGVVIGLPSFVENTGFMMTRPQDTNRTRPDPICRISVTHTPVPPKRGCRHAEEHNLGTYDYPQFGTHVAISDAPFLGNTQACRPRGKDQREFHPRMHNRPRD